MPKRKKKPYRIGLRTRAATLERIEWKIDCLLALKQHKPLPLSPTERREKARKQEKGSTVGSVGGIFAPTGFGFQA